VSRSRSAPARRTTIRIGRSSQRGCGTPIAAASATAGWRSRCSRELDRADPLAARLDHVLRAVDDGQVAVRIDRPDVAGRQPPVGAERVAALVAEIAAQDERSAHVEVPGGLAVVRELAALAVDDLDVDAEHRTALPRRQRDLGIGIEAFVPSLRIVDRAHRTHLGHAPSVQHADAELVAQRPDHRGRAAAPPIGRCARGPRSAAAGTRSC
jgi:hypothetical protein